MPTPPPHTEAAAAPALTPGDRRGHWTTGAARGRLGRSRHSAPSAASTSPLGDGMAPCESSSEVCGEPHVLLSQDGHPLGWRAVERPEVPDLGLTLAYLGTVDISPCCGVGGIALPISLGTHLFASTKIHPCLCTGRVCQDSASFTRASAPLPAPPASPPAIPPL